MKVFFTLAAALLLPVIVNAQNGTTVNVSSIYAPLILTFV